MMPTMRLFKFRIQTAFVLLALMGLSAMPSILSAQKIDVWVGTSGKDGIFHLKLDTASGKLSKPTCEIEIAGSGFLAMHPNGTVLYSTAKYEGESGIAAYSIERTAGDSTIKMLNFRQSGDGGAACVAVDKTGKVAMSAQYGGGSASTYTLKPDGAIEKLVGAVEHGPGSGVVENRQRTSHPHWVGTSPDNRFMFVPDLGKDAVVVYQLDTKTGKPTKHAEVETPPGSGPRHMKFHPSGKYAYVLNELTLTVSVFNYDAASAGFKNIQLIETLPAKQKDKHLNSAAEIRVHPSGKFVYTSNRGHDSITVFSVDQSTGKLTFIEHEHIRGAWPRNFNIDPSGKWLLAAGQHSNTLAVFEINQKSGELTYARQCVNIPNPICVLFKNE